MTARNMLVGLLMSSLLVACGSQSGSTPSSAPDSASATGTLIQLQGPSSGLKVNGVTVPQALVDAYARKRGWEIRDPGQRDQVYDKLGELLAVAMAAQKKGLLEDASVRADLELERLNYLGGIMIEREVPPVTEQEMRADYEQELAASGSEEWQVAHVLVESADRAAEVLASLQAGSSFDQVMQAEAGKPGVRDAKELGWVRRNQLPPALADALATLAPGEWTREGVQTEFGIHVAVLRDKRPFVLPAFEKVQEAIRSKLINQHVMELAKSIKSEAKIEH